MIIGIDASRAVTARRTGTEAYAYHLIRHLLPLAAQRGWRVKLYFNAPPPADWLPPTLSYEAVHLPFSRLWTHVRLAGELHRNPPNVFFTPAHVIPFSYRGRSIATIHDVGYRHFPAAHTAQQVRYLEWSTKHNARRSTIALVDSEATKRDVMTFYGTAAHKLQVVYPGYDTLLKQETNRDVCSAIQQKYAVTAPYFLYIGTLQPRKNLVRVIEAFGQIASETDQQLVLAGGRGWRSEAIFAAVKAQSAAVQARIVLTGYIDEADKAPLLSDATALIFPSLFEGFGFPVLEAQACGTPVLTARNSSLPEVAGDAALMVDAQNVNEIANGMRQLVADGALRAHLRAAGLVNVQRFKWVNSAEKNPYHLRTGCQCKLSGQSQFWACALTPSQWTTR